MFKGLQIAGFNEDPLEYFKVEKANRVNGDDLEDLMIGNTFYTEQVSFSIYKDGHFETYPFGGGGPVVKGKWWFENDMACIQSDKLFDGVEFCTDIYRTIEKENKKYDYVGSNDTYIFPLTIQELK